MEWFLSHAGLVGMLFFFAFFIGVCIWLYLPGMKSRIEPLAYIPLNEDQHEQSS